MDMRFFLNQLVKLLYLLLILLLKNTIKKLKRDNSSQKLPIGGKPITILPPPDKSPSDGKEYKVIRLPNNLTALLVSYGPEPYHIIKDFFNIFDFLRSIGKSTSSSSGEEDNDDDPAYESCRTSENVKTSEFAVCALSINVGSFSDPNEIPGLAHFLEHMVFLGSEKYPRENQFHSFIRKHGGFMNAATSCECTTFYFYCNVRHLFEALDMFSQLIISPLLKKESMVREREVLDSEFDLATLSDSFRIEQLIGTFASEENPIGKFMCGNSKTLKDRVSEDELYESLRSFHQQYYSANLMTVAILARLPIVKLENYALECFTSIPDHQVSRPTYNITKPLFIHEKFHRMYYVTSVENVTKVVLMWEMPPIESLYHSKPADLIGWLVDHEGKGSLLSYLKSKLWALGLWSDINPNSVYCNSLFSLFRIEITLSEWFAHLMDVITATFSYLKLVRASLPQRRLYNEVKTLSDLYFRFQEEQTAAEFLVEDMHYYPSKDFLAGPYLYFKYSPEEITKLLEHITPETVNIIVQAKEFSDSVVIDQVEPWFQTKYGSVPISSDQLSTWQNVELYSEFKLPSRNPFISSDFRLVSRTGNKSKYPTKIKSDEFMEVWYKLDTVFKFPTAWINLHFLSPAGMSTSKSLVMLDLFVAMISYILIEDTYPANLAHLHYDIQVSPRGGILLTTKGFNHKLPKLLATVINCMKNFSKKFNVDMFNTLKVELKKNYRNTLLERNNLVQELHFTVIEEPYFNASEKYSVVSHIREKEFIAFIDSFLGNSFVQCLVQGNISRKNAINICHNSIKIFNSKPIAKKDLPYVRIRRIPVGQKCVFMKTFNELDSNSVTVNYFQWGNADISQYVKLELLVKLMEEKVFNVLRTQEQLGYDVFCELSFNFGIIGFTITVHSSTSKFETSYVEKRISLFLDDFSNSLNNYKHDEFYKEREALIRTKGTSYYNLEEEVNNNLWEIIMEEYVFDRKWKEFVWLHKVSLSDIKAMLTSIRKKGSDQNRRLTIQVIGNQSDAPTDVPLMDDQSFDLRLLEGEENLKNYYVKEIKTFKSNLFLYPKSKIINGSFWLYSFWSLIIRLVFIFSYRRKR
ncbi:nardilysin-like [Planococcus citri]|uniref:nardilysin-like n=1 Tax=Planococcus citri TaxID=170843 RepID=UPI0031FA0AC6